MKRDFVIGSLHRAAPPIHHDQDALRLQDALLSNHRQKDWDGVAIVVGMLAIIAMAAWGLA